MYVDWVRQYSLDETTESGTGTRSRVGTGTGAGTGDGAKEDTVTRIREAIRRLFWR